LRKFAARRALKITLFAFIGSIFFMSAAGYAFYCHITRSPLPQVDGELGVAGLHDSVEIIRDKNGIPNIYASDMHDVYFAQGYTMAQDRWWQMEWFRHICTGRLEELTGQEDDLLASDIAIRTLGWRYAAEGDLKECSEDSIALLQAFADGVNAYIMDRAPGQLAVEYTVLGLNGIEPEIEPWTPVDTLAFTRLVAYELDYVYNTETLRSLLYGSLGKEMTDEWLTPPWPFGIKPSILEPEDLPDTNTLTTGSTVNPGLSSLTVAQSFRSEVPDKKIFPGHDSGFGSNNWVATGSLTESGKPLLANDPHLSIQMPSMWYEIGLHCPDDGTGAPFNVTGFAFTPAPGVVIGHNNNIAWAMTVAYPDVCDTYRIKVNPDNPLQYEWNGQWRDMTVSEETIRFGKGEPPETIRVRSTHFGPIINDNRIDEATGEVSGFNNEDPLAVCWTALEPSRWWQAVIGINKAGNWEDFRNALKDWDIFSQNILYADSRGNIGYQMPGRIPIRAGQHSGLLPAPGWTDEYEWKGFIPFELLPCTFNPQRNYIITANQAVVPPEYYDYLTWQLGEGQNYILSHECDYGYRAQRILQLIKEKAPNTVAAYQAIQGDYKLISAGEIMPFLADLRFDDAELTRARDWLSGWDCQLAADSPQAALYAEFWTQLINNTYYDELKTCVSPDLKPYGEGREMWSMYLLLQKPDDPWWDDVTTRDVIEKRDEILSASFRQAYKKTVAALGHDRNNWRWGSLHTATFISSPLGEIGIGLIERIVNRGPVAVGGGNETVNPTYYGPDNFDTTWISSMRMIIDTSDFSNSVCINSTGQSGHPASPYYGNMINDWQTNRYHAMLWTRKQVQDAVAHKLLLNPGAPAIKD
jgi:penicillin G amidase